MEAIDALAQAITTYGVAGRPLRRVVARLTEGPQTLEALVSETAVPRRTVESVMDLLGSDLEEEISGFRIRSEKVALYRECIGYEQLKVTGLSDPLAAEVTKRGELVGEVARIIAEAPAPVQALDHVSATADTLVRRALWLDSAFDLGGSNLLCLGDHDLTSLAVARINPDVRVVVADIDEGVLRYVEEVACRRGLNVRGFYADFRFGLPGEVREWADLVFTDPPYTPEGVRLFLARGLESLRNREHGRVVMAYGYSDRQPTLGRQVQESAQGLGITFEAILPHFNRYVGAQAVGSASDLYVCRPTARSWKVLAGGLEVAAAGIYTHGPRSNEARQGSFDRAAYEVLEAVAIGGEGLPLGACVTSREMPPGVTVGNKVRLETLFAGGLPARRDRYRGVSVAVDLAVDPGAWLLRVLLAANAARLAILVPNDHPDVSSEDAQSEIRRLVGHKYRLRFLRNQPDSHHAVVEAVAVGVDGKPAALANSVLCRAHGKLGNVWREGLVQVSRQVLDAAITKNQAREIIRSVARRGAALDGSLMTLPRHQIAELLADVAESARQLGA